MRRREFGALRVEAGRLEDELIVGPSVDWQAPGWRVLLYLGPVWVALGGVRRRR